MRHVCLAADHAGFTLKEEISASLRAEEGYRVLDLGTHSEEPVDYPDVARKEPPTPRE
jgi:ribose 5-phosphate isomerase RpiB